MQRFGKWRLSLAYCQNDR